MKRFFGVFVLTPGEQRLIIFVILLLVAVAWVKRERNLQNSRMPQLAPSASPTPQGYNPGIRP
jgi:hypothetical protein